MTEEKNRWVDWTISLQSISQAGLYYSKEEFDLECYQAIRDIARDMIVNQTDLSPEKVSDLFCNEIGYQTPKLDTRAVIFEGDKILLVKENNGTWSL
ncbi:hypothetical protein ADO06_02088 [Streptococcus parauberis]|nr:hypothetical protein ADO06_02088 [Streptococcus parauberis]